MTSTCEIHPATDWHSNRFLAGLAADLLHHLAPLLERHDYAEGTTVLREGDPSDHICLLAAGRVAVYKGRERARLGSIEAGGYFGEMGVLNRTPRSTTVMADTPVTVWSLSLDALRRFREETGYDLLEFSLRAQADVLGERLAQANSIAVESLRQQMEEFRIRVAFGTLLTNVILMIFLYTSALGLLRELSTTGSSTTLTTSALLILMAAGSALMVWRSGFPAATFGLCLQRWRWVLADSLRWTVVFCAAITLAKAALLRWGDGYGHLPLFKPWVSADGLAATLIAYGLYVVLSPVQEFVARGVLQGSLQHMLTGRHVTLRAIMVANAIFSISHQHLGLGYALAVFLPGVFWGWLYHRHGSLLGVGLSHILIGLWGTGLLDLASVVSAG